MKEKLSSRYEILEQIGSGGMSVVYRAKRINDGTVVALKILKPEMAENTDHIRRFKKEALSLSSFSHPNIVTVYDVGNVGTVHYIEMEFVEGETLKKIIDREGMMPAGRAVNIALSICSALKYAHSKLIIHRDVKSQNILVTPDGEVKVADFGIARDISSSTMTFGGANVMGSVHYFSPEQAKGEIADAKSDIYSLGIVFYEMLMGTVPFKGDTTVSIALKHLQEPIIPLNNINKNIPEVLSRIVLKATRKEPSERYQTMEEIETDLIMALVAPQEASVMQEPQKTDADKSTPKTAPASADRSHLQGRSRSAKKKKNRTTKNILKLSLAAMLLIGLLITMILIGRTLFNAGDATGKFYVPKFVGKSEAEAQELANKNELKLEITRELAEDVDEGYVVSQSPDIGNTISPGSIIQIVISVGRGNIEMPDLTGYSYAEAFATLDELGLRIETKNFQISNEQEGTILAQEPEIGTSLKPGDGVELWISGEEDVSLVVPVVTSQYFENAILVMKQNNLQARFLFEESSQEKPGTVLRTNPAEGMKVIQNSPVDFYISKLDGGYSDIFEFVFSIPEENTDVIIAVEMEQGTELVAFRQTYQKGPYTISVPISSNSTGEKKIKLYMNGELMQQQRVNLAEVIT
ncbi:MAG: Stk1 family PASTA domain-containing Ser/Thr kinase [Christensenellales bacterium]